MAAADFVVVANRLPVDRVVGPDGEEAWRTSPGGLVAALEPMMRSVHGAWVGWAGQADPGSDGPVGGAVEHQGAQSQRNPDAHPPQPAPQGR